MTAEITDHDWTVRALLAFPLLPPLDTPEATWSSFAYPETSD